MGTTTPKEPIDILLVEDNPGDVRLTQEAFKSIQSEVNFHTVSDGEQAAQYIRRHNTEDSDSHFDLVLLDLNLPRINGFAVLDTLDEELDYPPPPVLILSSSETKEDVIKSYEKNANAYLMKPDGPKEFGSMAQAIEDFWIDTARHPPTPT